MYEKNSRIHWDINTNCQRINITPVLDVYRNTEKK
jgi:hypothetical protein